MINPSIGFRLLRMTERHRAGNVSGSLAQIITPQQQVDAAAALASAITS